MKDVDGTKYRLDREDLTGKVKGCVTDGPATDWSRPFWVKQNVKSRSKACPTSLSFVVIVSC